MVTMATGHILVFDGLWGQDANSTVARTWSGLLSLYDVHGNRLQCACQNGMGLVGMVVGENQGVYVGDSVLTLFRHAFVGGLSRSLR